MIERRPSWPVIALTALSLSAILGGLAVTGGPGQGRMEKRDAQRRDDLNAIERQLQCRTQETGALTVSLDATPACPVAPNLVDPYTGRPYDITLVDQQNVKLCAEFETKINPEANPYNPSERNWTGNCVVVRIEPILPSPSPSP